MTTAYCFDFDGTLVDLPVEIEPVRQRIESEFAALGVQASMRPLLPSILMAAEQLTEDPDAASALVDTMMDYITEAEVTAAAQAHFCEGARELLEELTAAGAAWGIVTDNDCRAVRAAFAALGAESLLAGVPLIGRGNVERGKPFPDGMIIMLRSLTTGGPAFGNAFVFGDSPLDIEAAQEARPAFPELAIYSGAVLGGRGARHSLVASNPDALANTLREAFTALTACAAADLPTKGEHGSDSASSDGSR